jgi:hypothetical protein
MGCRSRPSIAGVGEKIVSQGKWIDRRNRFASSGLVYRIVLAAGVVGGCNRSEFPLAPVSGHVTLDGRPLAGGGVTFQPIAKPGTSSAGRGSAAFCDEAGRYTLETIDGEPGAVVGEHRVRIYGPRKKIASADDRSSGGSKEVVPSKYNFDTKLQFTVTPEGSNNADFELKTSE